MSSIENINSAITGYLTGLGGRKVQLYEPLAGDFAEGFCIDDEAIVYNVREDTASENIVSMYSFEGC